MSTETNLTDRRPSWWLLLGLALVGVPRVVAHDLGLAGPVLNAILVFAPPAVWVAVVLWRRWPRVFVTLLYIGLIYGVLLAVTHQLLWPWAFDSPPELGGNLAGKLSPGAEAALLRTFAVGSSLATGALVGAVTGAVGWLIAKATPVRTDADD